MNPARIAPTESQVDDFVTWYIERLKVHKELKAHKEKGAQR